MNKRGIRVPTSLIGNNLVKSKRSQLTIFLIIAVVLVGVVIIFFVLKQTKPPIEDEPQIIGSIDVTAIINKVNLCLKDSAKYSVSYIGFQGGYYNLPEKNTIIFTERYPIFMDKGQNIIPSIDLIQSEISNFTEIQLIDCFDDFKEFKEQGFDINQGKAAVKTKINQDNVAINLTFPLTITKGDSSVAISKFSTVIRPAKLPKILNFTNQVAAQHQQDPRGICLACISSLAEQNSLDVTVLETFESDVFLFRVIDSESNFTDYPYNFYFASRYDFPNCNNTRGCLDELSN